MSLLDGAMTLDAIDGQMLFKEKYRNLKRKLKFLIYVSLFECLLDCWFYC